MYELFAFVEFIEGDTRADNHYIGYKKMNDRWLMFDDECVFLVSRLEDFYNTNLAFYRARDTTTPYTRHVWLPKAGKTYSIRRQAKFNLAPSKTILYNQTTV